MNQSKKVVGHTEALNVARALRWRMDYLEENGVTGCAFLAEIEEELATAEALLSRQFTAKAAALHEMIQHRVARIKNYAFDSINQNTTVH